MCDEKVKSLSEVWAGIVCEAGPSDDYFTEQPCLKEEKKKHYVINLSLGVFVAPFYLLNISFKVQLGSWRDGSAVKGTVYSSRGPQSNS